MNDRRAAWFFVAPALLAISALSLFPLFWSGWESLHRHDLRMPWLGRPFIGLANYAEIAGDPRFWGAAAHTVSFTVVSVALEIGLGLVLALGLNRALRGRGLARTAVLLPWALPTVVAALLWRFLFDPQTGPVAVAVAAAGAGAPPIVWFIDPLLAWVPIVLADVWKTTPFVALLLLAALQGIPSELAEAAAVDGAGAATRLFRITLPLLRPAIAVALLLRIVDAFRVFDLIYVMTNGGPGTATEPIALYTFDSLFQNLRSGYAAALSVIVFALALAIALVLMRLMGRKEEG